MVRRQMEIKGTERKSVPEVEEAGEAYREVRDERAALKDREKQKHAELVMMMRTHKVKVYKYKDHDGTTITVKINDREPTVSLKKTAEEERHVAPPRASQPDAPDVHKGLIAQAEASMAEANVAENDAGDVVVPDKAAAKKSRKKKGK